MRKLIYGINLSADGCVAHDKLMGTEDIHIFYANILRETDTLIYGRITYELMVPFWPDLAKSHAADKATNDFAAVKNVVMFSRSSGLNLKDEIIRLKKEPGKDMLVGGVDIPEQLIQIGLIDEYLFVVQPIIVGEGRRLMKGVNLQEQLQLRLVETKVLSSGSVAMRFVNM